jgi:hypothetical protein
MGVVRKNQNDCTPTRLGVRMRKTLDVFVSEVYVSRQVWSLRNGDGYLGFRHILFGVGCAPLWSP